MPSPSRWETVSRVTSSEVAASCFDLEVEVDHSYMVGPGVIVHNCEICIPRDGKLYTLDHKPIGHSIPWGAGPGRLHMRDRCTSVPELKTWRELGISAAEVTGEQRAALGGFVPSETTFEKWIATQPAAVQNQALGVRRATLLRSGKETFREMFDRKGHLVLLEDLRAGTVEMAVASAAGGRNVAVSVATRPVSVDLGSLASNTISGTERKALEDWTLGNKWEKLNEALRDGSALTLDQEEMVRNIDSAINKMPEMKNPVTVFRGINFGRQAMPSGADLAGMSEAGRVARVRDAMSDFAEKRFPVGATIELGGYQSTSRYTAPAIDASLSRSSPGIVFQISAKKGIDLSKISRLDDEAEILLPRNSRFRVLRIERNAMLEAADGRTVIRTVVHVEQI